MNGESSDRDLVAAFVERRSEVAFRQLYRRHTPRLYRFVRRLLGGAERDAEDLLQETWLRAARSLARFRFEAELRTWLFGIAMNVCRERQRQEGRASAATADLAMAEEGRVAPGLGDSHRLELEEAILALPDGYRQVFLLHDLEGYTHREIAELLEVDEGTSKSQLARARAALRRSWRPASPTAERLTEERRTEERA